MSGAPYNSQDLPDPFVGAQALLEIIFPIKKDRPSQRWLQRQTKARAVPSIKIGGKRFYEPAAVRKAIKSFEISAHE
jgi:hypothetical protein